jgi:uncharacterized protein YhbP (UPF0306 family)
MREKSSVWSNSGLYIGSLLNSAFYNPTKEETATTKLATNNIQITK